MFKNIFYYLLLLFFTCQSAFSGEDVPTWADCYTHPKLHPVSQPRPGQRNRIINVSTHDINFYNRFMTTPLHHIEAAKQAFIESLRESLPISPGLYEADYRDLRDLFFDGYRGDIALRDEQAPLTPAHYHGISKDELKSSAKGLTPAERRRLTSIQSPRVNPTSETMYGDVVVGEALKTVIAMQEKLVKDAKTSSHALNNKLHDIGLDSLAALFGKDKNYAHLTLVVVALEEGKKNIYSLSFPGLFSSGTTPLAIPETDLFFNPSGIVGFDAAEFNRIVYFLDAVFPKEVAHNSERMKTLSTEQQKEFLLSDNPVNQRMRPLHQKLFGHAKDHFPVATRANILAQAPDKTRTYEHSEQALEQVIEHLGWIPKRLSRFRESHPRAHILGVMKLVATLRDACSNCAREMYYKAGYSLGYEGRLLRERIPFGVVVSGFETYKQMALLDVGKTAERFSQNSKTRVPTVVNVQSSMDLMGQPFMTYMG
jgi:hypothetical protein